MDWYLWLSKTGLDPLLTYKYAHTFTTNQLQEEDITQFDHEFLQSLGISVAKHRLEILKLSGKNVVEDSPKSSIALAIKKTKSLFGKYWARRRTTLSEQLRSWSTQWRKKEAVVYNNNRRIMRSGPIERTMGDTYKPKNSRSVSGPLDRKMQERLRSPPSWNSTSLVCTPQHRTHTDSLVREKKTVNESALSPRFKSHYKNKETMSHDSELYSVWSLMFKDIKPT